MPKHYKNMTNIELDIAYRKSKGGIYPGSVKYNILTEMKKRGKGSILNFRVR